MAIELRSATAENYNSFDPGDSVLKSNTLLGVYFEATVLIVAAVRAYNQDNAGLPYPAPSSSSDDESSTANFAIEIPYRRAGTAQKATSTIAPYTEWVTPTTGELEGIDSLMDAFVYLAEAVVYGNDKLVPTLIVNSAKTFVTFADNRNDNNYSISSTLPYNSGVDATGVGFEKAQNYFLFLDMQENLPFI